ncbi:cartilage intermediate layer protein 2-like [Gouania willdenowi]|uniref:cartilage intermediate layer protein 2-like n=1 Tax=Gouania willdenowi TaxID=441366 RepID=UPI0010545D23|nr:cartilage intermediate layer protein 2-like [Gouania willdenowi]
MVVAGGKEAGEIPAAERVKVNTVYACWTQWFDRDNPSGSGDWETLKDLRKENPGKICPQPTDIEARTLSGQNAPAPGDESILIWPTVGLICKNKDQKDKKCEDYRVRFRCSAPYCAAVCWTKWFDRDNPSGTGDWELLKDLRNENPGQICEKPHDMEVVTTDNPPIAAGNTGQNFYLNKPDKGFVCRNKDQKSLACRDYKVRFACPC